jgi:peptidoglycan hydrolase CwlO-like protein
MMAEQGDFSRYQWKQIAGVTIALFAVTVGVVGTLATILWNTTNGKVWQLDERVNALNVNLTEVKGDVKGLQKDVTELHETSKRLESKSDESLRILERLSTKMDAGKK